MAAGRGEGGDRRQGEGGVLIGWGQISDGREDLVSERGVRQRGILEYDVCPMSRVQPRMTWVLAYLLVPVH